MRDLVLVSLGIGFVLALGCTPRSYKVKTTTTATTVVEKKSEMLVSWNELNVCDYVVDKTERVSCFERLLVNIRLAKQVDSERWSEYEAFEKVVKERLCGLNAELGRDSPYFCPKALVHEPKPIVMDVYLCEICPSAKHFVRGSETPEKYPDGWQLVIPPDKNVIQLRIDGDIVAELDQPFSHYVVEAELGLPQANGKRPVVVTLMRVEGEQVNCSPPDIL